MNASNRAVAVVVTAGGAGLAVGDLDHPPGCRVVSTDVARGDRAACAVLTLAYDGPFGGLEAGLTRWADARGWSVTVAPVSASG